MTGAGLAVVCWDVLDVPAEPLALEAVEVAELVEEPEAIAASLCAFVRALVTVCRCRFTTAAAFPDVVAAVALLAWRFAAPASAGS